MRNFVIPELFFKIIAEKGNLYSRVWFYWLSEYVDEIFNPDFLEKQKAAFPKVGEISEIYHTGVRVLQQDFKILETKKKRKPKAINAEYQPTIEKVIEYLNEKSGATFKPTSSNSEIIASRIKEGFTISDFMMVIDRKTQDWKGTDWEKYLRPITLFAKTKFENYLNTPSNGIQPTNTKFTEFKNSIQRAKDLIGFRTESK